MINLTQITNIIETDLQDQKEGFSYNSYGYDIPEFDVFEVIDKINKSVLFFWRNPETNLTFLAVGRTDIEIFPSSESHFSNGNCFEKLKSAVNFKHDIPNIPLVCGGIKFSDKQSDLWNDFGHTDFFIPQVLLVIHNLSYKIVINVNLKEFPRTKTILNNLQTALNNQFGGNRGRIKAKIIYDEPLNVWETKINYALNEIEKSNISKVVLARKKTLSLKTETNEKSEACFLMTLSKNHNDATVFGYKKNNVLFFGASPEKFVSLHNNCLETDALAGSSLIHSDKNKFDTELLNDKKNINEHNQVLDYIIGGLKDITEKINFDSHPQIKNLTYIQHLWTPIKAKLKADASVLKVIDRLFPTPAVCGFPKNLSYDIIKAIEPDDRGMYAGLVGWFNLSGDSEFYVSLRSALLKENFLHAFAGCGIVEGSDAIKEYNETNSKFIPILNLVDIED